MSLAMGTVPLRMALACVALVQGSDAPRSSTPPSWPRLSYNHTKAGSVVRKDSLVTV
jgi:hypothetical protein